jgi:hypothetical protein
MFTKTTFALAFRARYRFRRTRGDEAASSPLMTLTARGTYVGADPDAHVRFELRRDSDRGY